MKERDRLARSTAVFAAVVLGLILLGGAYRALAAPAVVPEDRPAAALLAVSWRTTYITQTTDATARTTQAYAYQDVTCSFDFHNNQRITVTLQASNDNSGWFTTHTFTGVATDTTASTGIISRTLSYGRYERMRLEAMTAYQVTPTCKSVFFSNWTPPAYVAAGNDLSN